MSSISVIAVAVTMAFAFAPGVSEEAPSCTDYFDCGYTMPPHLIINAVPGVRAEEPRCTDYFDCGYAMPAHRINDPASGGTANGTRAVEFTPFEQGPPTYNDWRRTQGAVE